MRRAWVDCGKKCKLHFFFCCRSRVLFFFGENYIFLTKTFCFGIIHISFLGGLGHIGIFFLEKKENNKKNHKTHPTHQHC